MIEKRCPKCGLTKPIAEWSRNSSEKDGLQNWCKSCLNGYHNERRASDQEFVKRNRERIREWKSDPVNAERNRELNRELSRKWKRDNPEKNREKSRRRRAAKKGNGVEKIDLVALFERDGWVCHLCGESVDRDLKYPDPGSASHDHVIPLSRGGTHTWNNVKLAHLGCNISKGNKILKGET